MLWLWGGLAAVVVLGMVAGVGAAIFRGTGNGAGGQVTRFMHIHGLEIPPWAPEELFVSTHQGLIRVDTAGEWWFVSEAPHDFMGFSVHPEEKGVLFSSGHPALGSGLRNPIGFMVSRDSGVTWQPLALHGQADFHAMAVYPGDGDIIYGWNVSGNPGLYQSTDGGQTWGKRYTGALDGHIFSLAVHPEVPERILAGTRQGLWISVDGGTTWEHGIADAPVTAVAFHPANPQRLLAYVAAPDQGLVVMEGEAPPRPLGLVLPEQDAVFHIAIHPGKETVTYAGTGSGSVFKTADGGATWEPVAENGVPLAGRN